MDLRFPQPQRQLASESDSVGSGSTDLVATRDDILASYYRREYQRRDILFNEDQVSTICTAMIQDSNYDSLSAFLQTQNFVDFHQLQRSRAYIAYGRRDYSYLYCILERHQFPPHFRTEMEDLWYRAHFEQAYEASRTFNTDHLSTIFPPPRAVKEKKAANKLTDFSVSILNEFYAKNEYPQQHDKVLLAHQSGLSYIQVSNWFKNKRSRSRYARALRLLSNNNENTQVVSKSNSQKLFNSTNQYDTITSGDKENYSSNSNYSEDIHRLLELA